MSHCLWVFNHFFLCIEDTFLIQNYLSVEGCHKKLGKVIPKSKASGEVANWTERKNPHTPVYCVKEFVCLSVCPFHLYLIPNKISSVHAFLSENWSSNNALVWHHIACSLSQRRVFAAPVSAKKHMYTTICTALT